MTLGDLVSGLAVGPVPRGLDTVIRGVAYDSRRVEPGFMFVAVHGMKADGNAFVDRAVAAGAAAIVSTNPAPASITVPWIQVADDRAALAALAARFFGSPSEQLRLVGITGTNGKTTTAYLVESVLKAAGYPAAVFGTIEYRGPDFSYVAERTTPEASDLQALLKRVVDGGWTHAV